MITIAPHRKKDLIPMYIVHQTLRSNAKKKGAPTEKREFRSPDDQWDLVDIFYICTYIFILGGGSALRGHASPACLFFFCGLRKEWKDWGFVLWIHTWSTDEGVRVCMEPVRLDNLPSGCVSCSFCLTSVAAMGYTYLP